MTVAVPQSCQTTQVVLVLQRENGTLPVLAPFESVKTELNFSFETI